MDLQRKILRQELQKNIFAPLSLSKQELNELTDLFSGKEYPRHQILVREGDTWDKVFYIQQGIIRLFYTDSKGREFNKGFFRENQLVWPVAPSARTRESLFTITALEKITAAVSSFHAFYTWLTRRGLWEKFALPYAETLAEQKFLREYEFLIYPAAERFNRFCHEYPDLVHRLPDYHLASYLGITNVSLSRIKSCSRFNIG